MPVQYQSEPLALPMAVQAVADFFSQAQTVAADPSLPTLADKSNALRARVEFPLGDPALRLAVASSGGTLQRLRSGAESLVRQAMQSPIRDTAEDLARARDTMAQAAGRLGLTEQYAALAREVAQAALRGNLVQDLGATQSSREATRDAVRDITGVVRAGDILVGPGDLVTPRHLDIFKALGLMQPALYYSQALAVLVFLTLLVWLLFAFLARLFPEVYQDFNRLLVICGVLAGAALLFRLGETSPYLEAYALSAAAAGSMVVALICSQYAGLVVAAFISLLFALIIPEGNVKPVAMVLIAGGVSAHLAALRSTHTETLVRTAGTTAIFNTLLLLVGTEAFGQQHSWHVLVATAAGGAVAALVAIGLTLALDRPLSLLTDFRLAELASPQQPLLQRLLREAPGTYQSCVMVGALAEPVAEALGLSSMLVRTGALYHDIGKLKRPYFFVENQFGGDNPHDKLSPYLSALIISSHPKDGAQLALEAGLPPPIVDLIAQHQGTDLIRYFYEKAVEQAPEGTTVPEESFRYAGPKPRTREAALLMLADSVEAASRTLDNPSPTRLERLVNRLVDARVADGQLDECPLTFAELTRLREGLIAGLHGLFHHRIKYPDQIPEEAAILAARLGTEHQGGRGARPSRGSNGDFGGKT